MVEPVTAGWATLAASIGALVSGIAAALALYYHNRQSKTFERDFGFRNLSDQNNALNLSRFYREVLKDLNQDIDNELDKISVLKKMLEKTERGENPKAVFEDILVPEFDLKDYHLINYKPSSAYNLIKCQRKTVILSEVLGNYKKVFFKHFSQKETDEMIDIADTVKIQFSELKSLVQTSVRELNANIILIEQNVEDIETRLIQSRSK